MSSGSTHLTAPQPIVRKANPGEPLTSNYGQTPGGTLFGTTPGGTRIIYTKDALLNLSRSPLSRSPPKGLAYIPGVTNVKPPAEPEKKDAKDEKKPDQKEDLFDMEM
ncbi:hypothetical protein HK097_011066 [Rhizophlyctis rosea]|uniref:Uncharacterized protein n=1 Tax=Rhizophlyctis rosea TaxID=64517 RepID=A0AAD5SP22_9FUNG|nr:hypothetical protein HK097_011066 [Rhizophlyctis rosea]